MTWLIKKKNPGIRARNGSSDFWDDPEKSQSKMKELKSMKDDVATYAKLKEQYEDIETMIEMGYEGER